MSLWCITERWETVFDRKPWQNRPRHTLFKKRPSPAMFGSYGWIRDGNWPSANVLFKRKRWNVGWRWSRLNG